MDREPLLPHRNPSKRNPAPPSLPPLHPLPEDCGISIPLPLTSSELKDRLIFGPSSSSPQDSSPIVDALNLSLNSPKPSSSTDGNSNQTISTSTSLPNYWVIDPNFISEKSNLHRSRTAPALATISEVTDSVNSKPEFGSQSVVGQAFFLLVIYLALGVLIYSFNRGKFIVSETHPVVDALYFCIVTMCTIGYGDITPNSTSTKIFSILFVLVGFGFVDILLSAMVGSVLDLQEKYMLTNLKRSDGKESSIMFDVKKGRMRIRMKVAFALGVVVLCIGLGAGVLHFVEKLEWVDSIYLSVMSVTTVGYGDRAFKSLHGRIFASIWLLVSTLAVARAFLYLAEARVDKRHRTMAKWVLAHDMSVSDFLAADMDNHGFVSKSEYVIFKLKELEKVTEKDIMQICKQFERLDTGNCGKITLGDLMKTHQR